MRSWSKCSPAGLELDPRPAEHTDLDHLIGSWQEDPAFDLAIVDFERVDEDAWICRRF